MPATEERPGAMPSEALAFIQASLKPHVLTHIQEMILGMCWAGATYQEISTQAGYESSYVRSLGAQLWAALTTALGQRVTKNTFRVIVSQHLVNDTANNAPSHQSPEVSEHCPMLNLESLSEDSVESTPARSSIIPLESPGGQVPIGSTLYIVRSPIEKNCNASISQSGALIRIKSAQQTGKTSLMARVLNFSESQGYTTVRLNLELANVEILSDVDRFFRWFCTVASKALNLPARLNDFWEEVCGSSYNCSEYFRGYLLTHTDTPVVLALDNVDTIFNYPELAADFFGMLRAWYESARYGSSDSHSWAKLRLMVVYSTDVYISLPTHQSPFNVGVLIELPEFTVGQVSELAVRYQLNWSLEEVKLLVKRVSGQPYLIQLTFYHAKQSQMGLTEIWESAITPHSIYSDYLQRKFWSLQRHQPLIEGIKQVMRSTEPQPLEPVTLLKLEGMGLISICNGKASSASELYSRYFRNLLLSM